MTARAGTLALLAASTLALAACGGDEEETTSGAGASAGGEAAVEATWADFFQAVEKGDGAAACEELSEPLAAPNEVNLQLGSPLPGGPSCEDTLSDEDGAIGLAAGGTEELIELEVSGDTASGVAGAAQPTFAVEDGEWKVSSLFGVLPESDPNYEAP